MNEEQSGPQIAVSELGGLLNMMNRACEKFEEVKDELKGVTSIGNDLRSLCEGHKRMEETLTQLQRDHKDANLQHASSIIQHDKDILLLTAELKGNQKQCQELQKAVSDLQKDMGSVFVKMAFAAGGALLLGWLIMQTISVLDKLPQPKTNAIVKSMLNKDLA